jgi:hypothetical protein
MYLALLRLIWPIRSVNDCFWSVVMTHKQIILLGIGRSVSRVFLIPTVTDLVVSWNILLCSSTDLYPLAYPTASDFGEFNSIPGQKSSLPHVRWGKINQS